MKLADVAAKQPNALVDGPFGSNLKLTDYVNDGVPVLQGKNITGNKFQWFDVRFISEKKAHSLRRSLVKEGDILIVKIGSIGYSAQIDSLHGYPHAMIPANLCKLTPDLSVIDPTFLVYYLNSNDSVDYLRSNASATSQPALSLGKIKELPIPLPPLTEQKRIVSLLRRADRLRQLRRTAHDLGDALLQSVFLEMFGQVRANDKKWELARFEDVCPSRLGKMLDEKRQTGKYKRPYLRNFNVQWFRLDLSDVAEMDFDEKDQKEFRLEYGDVLICEGGEVGRATIWRNEIDECYFQKAIHRARPDPKVTNPEYIVHLLWWMAKTGGLGDFTSQVTIAHLTGEKLKELVIPVPPLSLQEEFAGVVRRVEGLRRRMSEAERQVEGLFDALLAQTMDNGR